MIHKAASKTILLFSILSFIFLALGCEAFVRKFTRKHNKEELPKEELVLEPEQYKAPDESKEEVYRKYFVFWQSWQDELIEALGRSTNHKKQVSCADEAIKNLELVSRMLDETQAGKIKPYLEKLKYLREEIAQDPYSGNVASNRQGAERIKKSVMNNFSYRKVKDSVVRYPKLNSG